MSTGDTIIARATPPVRGSRAIVRLSGAATGEILDRLLIDAPTESGAHSAHLRLEREWGGFGPLELPCLLLRFEGPRSYTGEDGAEIQIPGNPALVDRVMRQALALVDDQTNESLARLAQPGEFTARAFLAGKLTSEQAEGVGALIGAHTRAELAAAQALLGGETGAVYRALTDELASALALVEAGIDFTDQEDVIAISPDDLLARLEGMIESINALTGPEQAREVRTDAPVVVLVGPPNAGKSTLFNALLGRERAVVSEVPGTTRDVIRESLDLHEETRGWGTGEVELVDPAGLGDLAADQLDAAGQQAARRAIELADVLLACDPAGRFDLEEISQTVRPVIRVRTKGDLPGGDLPGGDLPGGEMKSGDLSVCALDGWNLDPLRRAIADASARDSLAGERSRVIPRHHQALVDARAALGEALGACARSQGERAIGDPELIAGAMRAALDEVGQIAGEVSPDDVIGRIFATFCVGK